MCNLPFAKSRSRPDRSQRKAKLHKRIVSTNYAVPTGALDSKAAKELLKLFTDLNQDGQTIVMVTHSVKAASTAGRVLFIKDGKVFHQLYKGHLSEVQMYQKISDAMTAITAGGEIDE